MTSICTFQLFSKNVSFLIIKTKKVKLSMKDYRFWNQKNLILNFVLAISNNIIQKMYLHSLRLGFLKINDEPILEGSGKDLKGLTETVQNCTFLAPSTNSTQNESWCMCDVVDRKITLQAVEHHYMSLKSGKWIRLFKGDMQSDKYRLRITIQKE